MSVLFIDMQTKSFLREESIPWDLFVCFLSPWKKEDFNEAWKLQKGIYFHLGRCETRGRQNCTKVKCSGFQHCCVSVKDCDSFPVLKVPPLSGFALVSLVLSPTASCWNFNFLSPLLPPSSLLSGKVKYFSADLAGLKNKLKPPGCLEDLFYQLLAENLLMITF